MFGRKKNKEKKQPKIPELEAMDQAKLRLEEAIEKTDAAKESLSEVNDILDALCNDILKGLAG